MPEETDLHGMYRRHFEYLTAAREKEVVEGWKHGRSYA
jgi:hypothetical protein